MALRNMKLFSTMLMVLLACGRTADEPERHQQELDSPEPVGTSASPAPTPGPEPTPTVAVLARYDFQSGGRAFPLPGRLDEISGLATTPDGRVFAHDDERGRVHQIDPATGEVGKSFDLGPGETRADFEGIVVLGERFFLVTSSGFLYEFREGDDEANVPFRVTDTGLGGRCEVEGLDYDPEADALLLACKQVRPDEGALVVHRIPIRSDGPALEPLRIDRAGLGALGVDVRFAPSAVLVTPDGTVLLLSAVTEAVIEVDRAGNLVDGVALPRREHPQPEGLALGADGTLYIADEENGQDARLTVYASDGTGGA